MKTCEDCGTPLVQNRCPNCQEESFILEQYIEQDMEMPSEEFQTKAIEQFNNPKS